MGAPLYGEHYLYAQRGFLPDRLSEAEGMFLRAHLPAGRLLDLGCGHGRHLAHVRGFGLDRDPASLAEAKRHRPVVRADFTALPFATGAFAGAWCWYNTLATFDDAQVPPILRELGRCVAAGGTLLLQGLHRDRAVTYPDQAYDEPLADGGLVRDRVHHDPVRRRDEIVRELRRADGRVIEVTFFLRAYTVDEWRALLADAGFALAWTVGSLFGEPVDAAADELILGAIRGP